MSVVSGAGELTPEPAITGEALWNDKAGAMEFNGSPSKHCWRWRYRLRPDLPYWAREWVRAGLFFGALGLLYLAWKHVSG
jgi:hypothetical protein